MWKYGIFSLLCVFGKASIWSQTVFTTDQIIARAEDAAAVVEQQRIANFQRSINARLPFLDEISVRTQTRRSDIHQQDYQARIAVNGRKERVTYQQVQRTEIEVTEANKLEQRYVVLYEQYGQMLDYYAVIKTLAMQMQLLAVYEDKIKFLENSAALTDEPNPEALMKVEFDRDELRLRVQENQNTLREKMALLTGSADAQLDTSRWVNLAQISATCTALLDSLSSHPSSVEAEAKISLINSELALEKARGAQVFDFFQLRYTNRPGEPFRNDYSIGAGFNIPYNGSRNARKELLLIERYAAEQEHITLMAELQAAKKKALIRFFDHKSIIESTYAQVQKASQRYNLNEVAQLDKDGIETILLHQELQLRRSLKILENTKSMTEYYLEALFLGGFLDDKNWLKEE